MNTNSVYLINAILVLLVVRQIREHPMDLRSLAVPELAVGAAAVLFLHSVPARGNDVPLELTCVSAGAVMGGLAGLATYLHHGGDGPVLGRAGWLAAGLWITGGGCPDGARVRRHPRGWPGDRPVQLHASDQRCGRVGRRAGDDGPGRRARPCPGCRRST